MEIVQLDLFSYNKTKNLKDRESSLSKSHRCYLCAKAGADLAIEQILKPTFTDHARAKVPDSNKICQQCSYYLNLRCLYFNPYREKWVKLFARNWSWIESENINLPKISQDLREGLPVVSELPTRKQLLALILDPPQLPFLIAVAKSGQKHLRPWAIEAKSREFFPILFEQDIIFIQRTNFQRLEMIFRNLRDLNFSKKEIATGDYSSQNLVKNWTNPNFMQLEEQIKPYRGSQYLDILEYLH